MGVLLDTSLLIRLERAAKADTGRAQAAVEHLVGRIGRRERVGMSVVTLSELLMGVERADESRRPGRQALVERLVQVVKPIPFDARAARLHARLSAQLASRGESVGAHDLLIAASAVSLGWSVATLNVREFQRVPGLVVLEPEPALEL